MAERASKASAKGAKKKVAPRTKGTPAKPPAARKVAKASAPRKPAASRAAPSKAAARTVEPPAEWTPVPGPEPIRRAPPPDATWAPAQMGWTPVAGPASTPPAKQWTPVERPPGFGAGALAFDPATGRMLDTSEPDGGVVDPAAYRKGATRSILLNVVLGITLAVTGILFLLALITGVVLVAAPDSDYGESIQKKLDESETSPGFIILNALLSLGMFGVIPFLWVLGTRVVPWRGTLKFLQLRFRLKDWLLGVALVPLMFVALYAMLVAYTCAVDGCGALDDEPDEAEKSAMDDLLDNLNWPVVIIVAVCAGVGEEILFRGVLQRWLGVWGQGIAFGLAHAQNAYPPQVIFAFGLGVVFGYLFKRGWSLVSLILAHFLYDFVLLTLAMLYPELG